jgi:type IVB pilus formation R64 PilN family outer membrane protein
MRTTKTTFGIFICLAMLLSGCANYAVVKRDVDQRYDQAIKKIEEKQSEILEGKLESPLIRHAKTVWLGSSAISYERGSSLPPQFDEVTLNFSGRHNIASVAEIIQRATGLRVVIHPDVQVSMQDLTRTTGGSSTASGRPSVTSVDSSASPSSLGSADVPLQLRMDSNNSTLSRRGGQGSAVQTRPTQGPVAASAETKEDGGDYFVDVPIAYRGSLSGFLDLVTARLGLDWEYRNGDLEIRRFITRTFNITALPGRTSYSASLGKSGGIAAGATGGSTGSSGNFSSNMQVSSQSEIDYWANLEGVLMAMLTNLGRLAINQGTGTVTVTDIRDVVDRIARHVEEENRTMTRQIAFEVQLFTVRSEDGSDFGVDWNLIYQKLGEVGVDFTGPKSLASPDAGAVGVRILRRGFVENGSKAFLQAMASRNKVSLVTSQRAVTLNRQVVPVAVTSQKSYVAETKSNISGSGEDRVVSNELKVGSVTTGFVLNLMPSVTDRNAMVLTVGLDLSELRALPIFGTAPNQIQLPEVASTQFIQRVALRTGETLVLSGFEQVNSQSGQRTLDGGMSPGLGGSFAGSTRKDSLVFLITPVMVEGL